MPLAHLGRRPAAPGPVPAMDRGERLVIDSVNQRAANIQAALEYLSGGQRRTEP